MIHREIRRAELCRGGEDEEPEESWSRAACPDANTVVCQCGESWETEDTNHPGNCQACGALPIRVDRCYRCPLNELDRVRLNSLAGHLLERVIHLDFITQRFRVGLDEVSAEEVAGLKIYVNERDKYQHELTKRPPKEEE